MALRIMVRAPLLVVGGVVMAVLTSPQLALIFFVLIPLVVVLIVFVIIRAFPLFAGVQKRLDALNIIMQENLAGVRVVKAFARAAHETGYAARVGAPPLAELATLDDAGFRARFAGSPVKRIGRDRFVRNVLYAIGNSGDARLVPVAAALVGDADPAVADAARWAVGRLADRPGGGD